jgi:hypothetical protein
MSELKTNKVSPSTGTGLQLGDSGDTVTVPTGATLTVTDGIAATSVADGTVTNAEFQYINTLSSNAQTQISNTVTVANAALARAGGTMTGATIFADQLATRPQMKDYSETVNAIGSITAATNADLEDGNVQTVTMTANTFNFGITNALASHSNSLTLIVTNGGLATVTWVSGAHDGGGNAIDWAGGTAPTLTSSGVDVLVFTTSDGGTQWMGFTAGLDVK